MCEEAESPFHEGERIVQSRVGVRERVENVGRRFIRDFMPEDHRELFDKLPYVLVGAMDARGRPWASLIAAHSGFMKTTDERTLSIGAYPVAADPAREGLIPGNKVGLLGIELATRRRNRANGTIAAADAAGFTVRVEQSFGNCPKYIQKRDVLGKRSPVEQPGRPRAEAPLLSEEAIALVERADTFFIASTSLAQATSSVASERRDGLDVSHRGGRPGFVRVLRDATTTALLWPEFRGNSLFNTLGNLTLQPRAGLLFWSFETGVALSLSGSAEIVWNAPELGSFPDAERLVRFKPEEGALLPNAVPFVWSSVEPALT